MQKQQIYFISVGKQDGGFFLRFLSCPHIQAIVFFLLFCSTPAWGQGCSDAGFCTMGAMRPNQSFSKEKSIRLQSIELSQGVGESNFRDYIWVTTLDANFSVSDRLMVQVKVPFQQTSGPLANTSGLSDLSVSASMNLWSNEQFRLSGTLGGKIPTNGADLTNAEGRPLPMYYQTSLGTYDVVAGLALSTRNWLFATGYQMPLNIVDNAFIWGAWANSGQDSLARTYPIARDLRRGSDVMLRIERNFRFYRYNFYAGLLPIWRIGRDEVRSPQTGERVRVDGSAGVVATFLIGGGYRLSTRSGIKTLFGRRIHQVNEWTNRTSFSDGLSRKWVASVGYQLLF